MRYLRLYESFEDIHGICKKYNIQNYKINSDESIDVDGCVSFWSRSLSELPLKFNKVYGWFDCSSNRLSSLEGCPKEVNADFSCSHNLLTSLEGGPKEVNADFSCSYNLLTSFEYVPRIIRGNFGCRNNNIKSFEYFPRHIGGDIFSCYTNPIYQVWRLFQDTTKIELLNDFDIFRDEDTEEPVIIMDRLNDFLLTIGKDTVEKVKGYKNI